ncbi:exportin-6-like [Saccostrea cucullata]|uniref:exportin-6-like n=1 Tax=Saccostrea cuccullata TaxID=36930 RepID=UPI002ED4DE96
MTDSLMSFFLAVFQGLRVQMGMVFPEQTKQTFMTLCTQKQIAESIYHESAAAHSVVEKLFKIFELVQESGIDFKAFLPNFIVMCMDQIYPIIAQRPSPDIKASLYRLVHELMMNNWRYFFKGSVLKKLSVQHTPQKENGEMQRAHEVKGSAMKTLSVQHTPQNENREIQKAQEVKGSALKTLSVQHTPQNEIGEIQDAQEFTAIMQEEKEEKMKPVQLMTKPKKLGRMRRVAHWLRKNFFSCGGGKSSS